MFKKTLLAVAIAGASSSALAIPNFSDPVGGTLLTTYSREGAQSADLINSGQIYFSFGVAHTVGDLITVSFSQPLVGQDLDALLGETTHDLLGDTDPAAGIQLGKVGEITLGLLSVAGADLDMDGQVEANGDDEITSVTLRVTQIQENGAAAAGSDVTTKGQQVHLTINALDGFSFDGDDVRAADAGTGASTAVTMNYSATTSGGVALDGGLQSGIGLIAFDDQFESTVGPVVLDQVVNVDIQDGVRNLPETDFFAGGLNFGDLVTAFGSRTEFVGLDNTDTLVVAVSDTDVAAADAGDTDNDNTNAAFESYTVTLTATGLSFEDGLSDLLFAVTGAGGAGNFVGVPVLNGSTYTYTWDTAEATTITITEDGEVLDEATFAVDITVNYEDAGDDHDNTDVNPAAGVAGGDNMEHSDLLEDDAAAGEWVFNGTAIDLYAVPWSDNVELFIWLTNEGSEDAEVTARIVDSNGSAKNITVVDAQGNPVIAEAGKITALGNPILNALKAESASGRATVTIVTSTDSANVNIDASYKVKDADDRLRLNTTQTLNEEVLNSAKAK